MQYFFLVVLLFLAPFLTFAQTVPGYYRFPNIHGNTIIFTAEGDLWKVGVGGGIAQRLTSHPGMESRASVSPDGKLIAFSGQYEGATEVYTMPFQGGLPTRWTYEGDAAYVVSWTRDGKILYATDHFSTLPNTQLATIEIKTGTQKLIPLAQASEGSFDSTGTLYFTRLAYQGSHTKRYKGGTAQNLWKFDGSNEAIPLTADFAGTSKAPFWWNGRIYFVSDRDGTMNIWSADEAGKDLRQHTHHQGWDVKSLSCDQGKIVYQMGADIHLYDIASNGDRVVPITLSSDFDQTREQWIKEPMQFLSSAHLSADGDRLVLTARGRVFVVPRQSGRLAEITRRSGVRYRDAYFLSENSLVMLSDQSGEMEFWKAPANGVGDLEQITSDAKVFRYEGIPSPDGKRIAWTDKNQELWIHNIQTKKSQKIAASDQDLLYDLTWSPDSQWLAYARLGDIYYRQVFLYSVADETSFPITSERVDTYSPTWSPDGKWIYLLSDRFFKSVVSSPWGPRQPEPFFDKVTKIYAISLRKDGKFPFEEKNELISEEPEKKDKEKDQKEEKDGKEKKPPAISIDRDGIQSRLTEVPIPPGNYSRLSMTENHLFWIESETAVEPKSKLMTVELKNTDIKSQVVMEDIKTYELAYGGEKLLVQKQDGMFVIEANGEAPKELEKSKVDLTKWTFTITPREEWHQMFVDAWRLERDFFYDPNLHGVNWSGLLKMHLPLVDRVSDREELDDLISDLVGELSALHTFVGGGDKRKSPDQIGLGFLGAVLMRDEKAGGYRVTHIYQSDPDYPDQLSPLAKFGVHVHEGDVIEAINGVPLLSVNDPGIPLKNQANQQVLLHVKSSATGKSFDSIVKAMDSRAETNLRYDDWEITKRNQAEKLGAGKIAYVHLRAMQEDDISSWARNFYPVFDRDGLIVDVRNNGGGNIDSWILEKLLRKAWFFWKPRVGKSFSNMQYAFRGHMIVLCNEWTGSDGEAFTEGFRRLGLGKVLGTRTWGGEIWLSFDNRLVDKGIASAAELGVYGPEGQWLIEGHGVDPDMVVDNLPHATFNGKDAQLEASIKFLQEEIRKNPPPVPTPPAYPDKSKH